MQDMQFFGQYVGDTSPDYTTTGLTDALPLNSDTLSFFANNMQFNWVNGQMALCAAWPRVLTPAEITTVLNYLANLYN